jgi:hypothetical protein
MPKPNTEICMCLRLGAGSRLTDSGFYRRLFCTRHYTESWEGGLEGEEWSLHHSLHPRVRKNSSRQDREQVSFTQQPAEVNGGLRVLGFGPCRAGRRLKSWAGQRSALTWLRQAPHPVSALPNASRCGLRVSPKSRSPVSKQGNM